jgi:hypothetical protein
MYYCSKINARFLDKSVCNTRRERNDTICGTCNIKPVKCKDIVRINSVKKSNHELPKFMTRPHDPIQERNRSGEMTTANKIREFLDKEPNRIFRPFEIVNGTGCNASSVAKALAKWEGRKWKRIKNGRYQSLKGIEMVDKFNTALEKPRPGVDVPEVPINEVNLAELPQQELNEMVEVISSSDVPESIKTHYLSKDISDIMVMLETIESLKAEVREKAKRVMNEPSANKFLSYMLEFSNMD